MSTEEILAEIEEHLDKFYGTPYEHAGTVPRRSDVFDLFNVAYRKGYMKADYPHRLTASFIYECFLKKYPPRESGGRDFLEDLCFIWNEWQYALDHYRA